jgi:pimeloyl-ACP methyl ester carboxylesterase
VNRFSARDGVGLAYRELGAGRPLVLIHGYFSTAYVNWVRYGHAAVLADAGFRVIMPDLRAHGDSDHPHEPRYYPRDVLADDAFDLIAHLGLTDYDLGGYSLGGRTTLRMLVRGAQPGRAIVAGMGLWGMTNVSDRNEHFRRVFAGLGHHERGSAEWRSEAFLRTTGGDPVALEQVLDTSVGATEDEIGDVLTPTLVLMGEADDDHGSGADLADLLPLGRYLEIPGNHMSAVTEPELGESIRSYLMR